MRSVSCVRERALFLTTASVAALAFVATPAAAQGQDETESVSVDSTADEAGEDEIIITGTRILRPEFSAPNPIQAFTAEAIEKSGKINLTDFLVDTPALIGSTTSVDAAGSNAGFQEAGLNLLDLRNLGTQRTLVLVNGRRHVAGYPGVASVDVNTIPVDLVERVDVLTGGASAIYGADGVSGVVNFIMKNDFEGITARTQAGISERGDAENFLGSITAGTNFAGGRGNVAVAYEFSHQERFSQRKRLNWGRTGPSYRFVRNPADFPDDPNVPDYVPLNNLAWADSSLDGAVDVDFDGIPDYTGSGTVYDRGTLLRGDAFTIGGSSTPQEIYFGDYLPSTRRHLVNGLASFEVSPALKLFGEAKYVSTKSMTQAQPTFDFMTYLQPDNAFLLERFGDLAPDGALVSRDNFDFGIRADTARRETIRTVIGATGDIASNLRYEVSYVYGRATAKTLSQNDRYADRYFAALDSVIDPTTGQPTCRINLFPNGVIDPENYGGPPLTFTPGECVPLNVLGENVASRAALDFVTVDSLTRSRITQQVVSGSISGDTGTFLTLPGGAIGFALGAEYRKETSRSIPSQELQQGLLADSATIEPETGKYDVKEVFAEVNVPLLANVPFAETLSVGGAIRFSDYSTVGSTTTWKVDGVWAPVRDISFRGTYSEAVRAPNISELFAGSAGGYEFIDDPCDDEYIGEGTQYRAANCQALLGGFGIDLANFDPTNDPASPSNASIQGITGGNPDLLEETAKTWTAGVVLRPRFIRGLQIAVDWYNIKLTNAIATPEAQDVVDLCVDQPTLENVFCEAITRDSTSGYVSSFVVGPQNVASFETAGLDVTLDYRFRPAPGWGDFNLHVVAGYLDKLQYIPTPGADLDDDRREPNAPRWVVSSDLTWTKGPVTLNYGINWFDKTRRFTTERVAANPDVAESKYLFYKQRWEHEVQASVDVDERFTFYGGVNNLFDSKPDVGALGFPVSAVGRFFYVGARAKLDRLF